MSRIFPSAVLAGALMISSLIAAGQSLGPELKANHPSVHVVQRGDTLWDISGRFLKEPWLWPEVWRANPQIKNPHLIYPGDEVFLTYRDGRPIISVRRRTRPGHVRLSPTVRVESLADEPIPTIPVDAINQFLRRPRVATEAEFDAAPYILSVGAEALIARPGQKVYVRGVEDESSVRFAVYRKGEPYLNPEDPKEILGFEAIHVADAELDVVGDPSTLVLTRTFREVLVGDRLVSTDTDGQYKAYAPRPADAGMAGSIISVVDGVTQIGQYQTVVLDLGERNGVVPGVVFGVYQRGATVRDPLARDPVEVELERRREQRQAARAEEGESAFAAVLGFGHAVEATSDFIEGEVRKFEPISLRSERPWLYFDRPWGKVTLPNERAGTIMVYRTFDRVSYALVMEADRAMHVDDIVQQP